MGLRFQKAGNMYGFIDATWNPIRGKCEHDCLYCYMKKWGLKDLRLDVKDLDTHLGKGNFIFIGSGTDIFAPSVPMEWIHLIIDRMKTYPANQYFLQSKNTLRMLYYMKDLPENTVFCTTIESDIDYYPQMGKAPNIRTRYAGIKKIRDFRDRVMVTVEPVLKFNVVELSSMLISLHPEQVNIGADSKGHKMPEPSAAEIKKLVENLERQKIKVYQKSNLKRLLNE